MGCKRRANTSYEMRPPSARRTELAGSAHAVGADGMVRTWSADGTPRSTLTEHARGVLGVVETVLLKRLHALVFIEHSCAVPELADNR